MTHKMLCTWVIIMGTGPFTMPLAPSPTNPLCYNSPAYRNTHEQECVIDKVNAGSGKPGDDPPRGFIGNLLHGLTGGIL